MTYFALLTVGCWVLVVGAHELGHYLAFRMFGQKPKFYLNWFGLSVGNDVDVFSLAPIQLFIVDMGGILSGWILVKLLFQGVVANFVYLMICSGDFVQMIACTQLHKHDKASMLGAVKKQLVKVETEMKRKK